MKLRKDAPRAPKRVERPRSGKVGKTGSRRSPPKRSAGKPATAIVVEHREEVFDRLSSSLALLETVALALRRFEAEPTLGAICMALDHAVTEVGKAHSNVEKYLESYRTRS